MQVSAHFRDIVVVFVAAVDRPASLRNGVHVIESVDEALPPSQIEAVLDLTNCLRGIVDDRVKRAEQKSVSRVARIQESLREQATSAAAKLVAAEFPVPHLRGPESGGLDGIAGHGPSVTGGDFASPSRTEVDPSFTALTAKTIVALH